MDERVLQYFNSVVMNKVIAQGVEIACEHRQSNEQNCPGFFCFERAAVKSSGGG
jgi:hypothetical protein